MPESEFSDMINLLQTFRGDILSIEESRSTQLFRQANKDLQNIYSLHLSAKKTFAEVEHYLKNLYTSFNFVAAVYNDVVRKKPITAERALQYNEGLEVMIKCCDVITSKLKNKK